MADDDNAARMVEALQGASSLQLSQMQALIEGMLADTKRMIAARSALHLGQPVRFIDHRTGQVRLGKLIAQHDVQATVLEDSVRRTWKIPYVAIEPALNGPGEQPKPYDPPPEPPAPPGRVEFRVGDHPKIADIKFSRGAELADQMLVVAGTEKQKQQSMLAKATLYWEWKKYDVAYAAYQEAIKAFPDFQRFHEDIAALLVEMGRPQEGRDAYALLYERSPDKRAAAFIGAGYAEAAAKANSSLAELENALNAGLLSISNQPDEPFSYYAVAMVCRAMNRRPEALKYLRDAESREASRDVNIHTYDRTRHLKYKALLNEWR
ncbi:hypothetical protein V4F39_23770 [Aquincola sp. MAHUQ-54]|uniref:Tetratricopeptide repeat protein n=1 Tax=Aquincola agrisoli TaxID=3119538 RepID=A0AAW9QLD8_9BURK